MATNSFKFFALSSGMVIVLPQTRKCKKSKENRWSVTLLPHREETKGWCTTRIAVWLVRCFRGGGCRPFFFFSREKRRRNEGRKRAKRGREGRTSILFKEGTEHGWPRRRKKGIFSRPIKFASALHLFRRRDRQPRLYTVCVREKNEGMAVSIHFTHERNSTMNLSLLPSAHSSDDRDFPTADDRRII